MKLCAASNIKTTPTYLSRNSVPVTLDNPLSTLFIHLQYKVASLKTVHSERSGLSRGLFLERHAAAELFRCLFPVLRASEIKSKDSKPGQVKPNLSVRQDAMSCEVLRGMDPFSKLLNVFEAGGQHRGDDSLTVNPEWM